jgi:hypothetical protein
VITLPAECRPTQPAISSHALILDGRTSESTSSATVRLLLHIDTDGEVTLGTAADAHWNLILNGVSFETEPAASPGGSPASPTTSHLHVCMPVCVHACVRVCWPVCWPASLS